MKQKFIIYAYSFDINSGGIIVLHQLCHLLNQQGHDAKLWIHKKPIFNPRTPLLYLFKWLKFITRRQFKTYPNFHTPIANTSDLKDAIIIYPEIIDGNPLDASKVVRWLLHKPGFHTGRINFLPEELIVGYGSEFNGENINFTEDRILVIKFIMNDIYKQTNFGPRLACCHMIRKGKNKPFIHPEDSILVDSLSHEELSTIFNQAKMFISYDAYTYYSTYAALCGCISVVVPDENISKEQWYVHEKDRYGKAYGLDDIDYAISTKKLMLEYLKEQENRNKDSVANFITVCNQYFTNK